MDKTKNCPYCGEEIMADARKCKHCGEWLEEEPIQEQTQEEEKTETDASICPNAESEQTEPVLPTNISSLDKKPSPHKSKKWLLVVIPIVVAIVGVGLYLFGVFGNEPIIKGLPSKSENSAIGLKRSEDEIKAEIEKLVLEAYKDHSIYGLMSPDFIAAEERASNTQSEEICIDADYFYENNDEGIIAVTEVTSIRVEMLAQNTANVYLTLGFEFEGVKGEIGDLVLVMIRQSEKANGSNWLVDDVIDGEGGSTKNYLLSCAEENWNAESDEIQTEVERQVLNAYNNGIVYELLTPGFKRIENDYNELGVLCMDPDYCYMYSLSGIVSHRAEMLEDDKANVYLTINYYPPLDYGSNDEEWIVEQSEIMLSMLRKDDKWLVDDVVEAGYSTKEAMVDCIKEESGEHGIGDKEDDYKKNELPVEITDEKTVDLKGTEGAYEGEIYQIVEEMPQFPGGEVKLMEYVAKNIKYPQIARETGVEGRVFVGFVIEPDGSISNVTLLKGIGGGCDEEALRVIKSLPKWEPGKEKGKAVRVSYQIPISFKLQQNYE